MLCRLGLSIRRYTLRYRRIMGAVMEEFVVERRSCG
jgi:hypothetical protein